MVFPVVMYGCESWTVKKAEYRRIDAFQLEKKVKSESWTIKKAEHQRIDAFEL